MTDPSLQKLARDTALKILPHDTHDTKTKIILSALEQAEQPWKQRYELALRDSQRRGELLDKLTTMISIAEDTKRLDWLDENWQPFFGKIVRKLKDSFYDDFNKRMGTVRNAIDDAMSQTEKKQ